MTANENKKTVLRFNKGFLEEGNTEVLKEIVADTFINHTDPANDQAAFAGNALF